MKRSLSLKTSVGVIWHVAQLFCTKGISLALTLVLAHFLLPSDFGLVAIVIICTSIASVVMDSGFLQALIRIKHIKDADYNTAFYCNLFLGTASYVILFTLAPFISDFYEQELTLLLRVAGLVVLINSFQIVQLSLLHRALDFKTQFKAALPASILSAIVTIYLAFMGYGVWSLIAQMILSSFLTTVLLWYQTKWLPSTSISLKSFKEMYSFGYKLFLADLLEVIFKNIYVVVIAKLFSTTIAGLYFFAEKILEIMVMQVITAIQSVTYPALVKKDSSESNLKNGYRRLLIITTFIISPVVMFLAAMSESLFMAVLDPKWWAAANYLTILCFIYLLIPIHALNLNILKVKGRSDWSLLIEVIKKVLTVLILLVSIDYGITGIIYGQLIASIISVYVNGYFSKRLIDYPIMEQVRDFIPNILLAGLIALLIPPAIEIMPWGGGAELLFSLLLGTLMYFFTARLLYMDGYCIVEDIVSSQIFRRQQGRAGMDSEQENS